MRRAFTVALVGPDGAGKSTVGRRLPDMLDFPSRYIYMGVNLESSTVVLPTTRLILELKRLRGGRPDMAGPREPSRTSPAPKGALKRAAASCKRGLRITNLIAEEWFRQLVVWYQQWRGRVVIMDRHFLADYYFHDVTRTDGQPLSSRLHGHVLRRFYPRPDLTIVLDAPTDVLARRKGESTPELLERRREEYLRLRDQMAGFQTVDAEQTLEATAATVAAIIIEMYDRRRTGLAA